MFALRLIEQPVAFHGLGQGLAAGARDFVVLAARPLFGVGHVFFLPLRLQISGFLEPPSAG